MIAESFNNLLYLLGFFIVAEMFFMLRRRASAAKLILCLLSVFPMTVVFYLINDVNFQLPLMLIYITVVMYFAYDEKKTYLFVFTLGITAAFSVINQMAGMIIQDAALLLNRQFTHGRLFDGCRLVLSLLFLGAVGALIKRKSTKGLRSLGWGYILLFALVLVVDSVVVLGLGDTAMASDSGGTRDKIIYGLVVIGIFIQLALIILLILSRDAYREKEMLTARYLEEQAEHYAYLENRERETRKFRHDIRNHMHMLAVLARQQRYDEFEEYMSEINGRIEEFGNKITVGNGIADAVLNKFYDEAGGKGITIRVEGHFPSQCSVSAYDLCVILSNLLSNALYAEEQSGGTEILVEIRYTDSDISIKVENDYKKIQKDKSGKLVSDKQDAYRHGFGMENIRECVEKNQGYMDMQAENNRFRIMLSLNNEME